jgi:restriction system protein
MAFLKKVKSRWHDDLSRASWQDFERLIAEYYRAQGYEVKHVGTGASSAQTDGGIDLKIYKAGKYDIVQCKHWNARQVTHNSVHELIGVMATEKADSAIIITSGEFTVAATQAASKFERITLIDGTNIRNLLKHVGISIEPKMHQSGYVLEQVEQYDKKRHHQTANTGDSQNMWNTERRKSKRSQKQIFARLLFQIGVPILFCILAIKFLPNFIAGLIKPPQITAPVLPAASAPAQALPSNADNSNAASKPAVAEIDAADKAMSDDELREWKKRNEESMKLLEESTPELKD